MKARCDRGELAECLGNILGIVPATQPTKPILACCRLKTDGEQILLELTDLDVGGRIRLERVEVLEAGELAVPATRFYSLLREIPDRQVYVEAMAGGRATLLRTDACEFKLLGDDPGEFPEAPVFLAEKAFSVSREKFLEALRRVAIATSRDLSRFQLAGVFLEVGGEKMMLTATDGKRLTHDQLRVDNPKRIAASSIVPNRAIDVLLKVLAQGGASIDVVLKDPDIQVSFGKGEVTSKVIQGTYPDYHMALAQKTSVKVSAKKAEMVTAVRTAALMTNRETATVLFTFADGKVSLTTQASDIGESRIQVPVEMDGENFEMRFNPTYFMDGLRCLSEEEMRLEISDCEHPATLRSGQHYRHLVMPLVTK